MPESFIDDLDGGADSNAGFRSLLHGPEPRYERFGARGDQASWLAAMEGTEGAERYAAETAERALLYVAATRAKRELTVVSFGDPSALLT